MFFEWDEVKNVTNSGKHGLIFEEAYSFEWDEAVLIDRSRHGDGELRFAAIGLLYGKLHTVIFTRRGDAVRLISMRRSNAQEEKCYEKKGY